MFGHQSARKSAAWRSRSNLVCFGTAVVLLVGLTACGSANPSADSANDPIWGTYRDDGGLAYTIMPMVWNDTNGMYRSATYSLANRSIVAQSDSGNAKNQGTWSRFDWDVSSGEIYVCQTASGASTQSIAASAAAPDVAHPTVGGCNGAPWTHLVPTDPLQVAGSYPNAQFGESLTVTQEQWISSFGATYRIVRYDNAAEFFIAQDDHVANFGDPDLYARFDWVTYQGKLYYCQTAFDQTTITAALATPRAITTNPTAGGCDGIVNNFTWNRMN